MTHESKKISRHNTLQTNITTKTNTKTQVNLLHILKLIENSE